MTVNIKFPRVNKTGIASHTRYFGGVLQPLIRAPIEATSNAAEMGMI
jgi:hypothetical protein